ncbi:MAG: formimidoylglutamate deiminase [Bacteroidota bacterium]
MRQFRFRGLLLESGWMEPAWVQTDDAGIITGITGQPVPAVATEAIDGYALPGFLNGHSHAFQYAMAGLAEVHAAGTEDDFWSWREAMYRTALSLDPDQAEVVAAMVYSEMVRVGYTHVAEFHYLHHDPDGNPYANPAEMGIRMLRAAQRAGIRITLVPVLYQQGGFGQPPQPRQRRFITGDGEAWLQLFEESANAVREFPGAKLGWSIHSLRAVDPEAAKIIFRTMPEDIPFHIHAAEQKREVSDCLDYCGMRPVQWLLEHLPVNENFFIVHATHLVDAEVAALAESGASVVLCPGTEGNLGDGIFRMKDYVRAGGNWCIGTDSHVTLNPLNELRMIDHRQRLVTHDRNIFDGDGASAMVRAAYHSGRRAMGLSSAGYFAIGQPLDAVVYDAQSPTLIAPGTVHRTAAIVHTLDEPMGTMIGGRWVCRKGDHADRASILKDYRMVMTGSR